MTSTIGLPGLFLLGAVMTLPTSVVVMLVGFGAFFYGIGG